MRTVSFNRLDNNASGPTPCLIVSIKLPSAVTYALSLTALFETSNIDANDILPSLNKLPLSLSSERLFSSTIRNSLALMSLSRRWLIPSTDLLRLPIIVTISEERELKADIISAVLATLCSVCLLPILTIVLVCFSVISDIVSVSSALTFLSPSSVVSSLLLSTVNPASNSSLSESALDSSA